MFKLIIVIMTAISCNINELPVENNLLNHNIPADLANLENNTNIDFYFFNEYPEKSKSVRTNFSHDRVTFRLKPRYGRRESRNQHTSYIVTLKSVKPLIIDHFDSLFVDLDMVIKNFDIKNNRSENLALNNAVSKDDPILKMTVFFHNIYNKRKIKVFENGHLVNHLELNKLIEETIPINYTIQMKLLSGSIGRNDFVYNEAEYTIIYKILGFYGN